MIPAAVMIVILSVAVILGLGGRRDHDACQEAIASARAERDAAIVARDEAVEAHIRALRDQREYLETLRGHVKGGE